MRRRSDGHEEALLRRARNGDAKAFEALMRAHSAQSYRVALRMLGNQADAEDATQDAFVRAWLNLHQFRSNSAFSTWMYRIVTNVCLTTLRERPVTQVLSEDVPVATLGPDAQVEVNSGVDALKRAILELTPEQRAPIVLREIEGCSYEEIAQILDLSVPAVRGRLHRARAQLAAALQGWT